MLRQSQPFSLCYVLIFLLWGIQNFTQLHRQQPGTNKAYTYSGSNCKEMCTCICTSFTNPEFFVSKSISCQHDWPSMKNPRTKYYSLITIRVFFNFYLPQSRGDNTFGSVCLSVCPFDFLCSPTWTVWPRYLLPVQGLYLCLWSVVVSTGCAFTVDHALNWKCYDLIFSCETQTFAIDLLRDQSYRRES